MIIIEFAEKKYSFEDNVIDDAKSEIGKRKITLKLDRLALPALVDLLFFKKETL